MKKFLLVAGAAALMASCTEMELDTEGAITPQQPAAGIAFSTTIGEGVGTRAQWDYDGQYWNLLWHAEKDKMAFYVRNADILKEDGTSNPDAGAITVPDAPADWTAEAKAIYKATRSEGVGYFTAADNDKMIWPKADGAGGYLAPEFVYVWPSTTIVAANASTHGLDATLPDITSQDQIEKDGSSTMKYAFMTGSKTVDASQIKDYTAGSDLLIDIKLERKLPLLGFFFQGYDAATFGVLQKVKLESLGEIKDNGEVDTSKLSVLNYGTDATWNLNETDVTKAYTVGTTSTANSVELNINGGTTGLTWGNGRDFTAFMTVNAVDRSKMKNGERMKITYTFANTTITREITVTASWELGHHFYAKDVSGANGYDLLSASYILFPGSNSLQLNPTFKGSIESIVNEGKIDGSKTPAQITKIVSNVALADADFTYIGKNFTTLVDLTLNENTSIPAFEIPSASSSITNLVAPKVTTIDEGAFRDESKGADDDDAYKLALTNCVLPSYPFLNVKLAKGLLKPASLLTADLSSVAVISSKFPAEGLSLQGFTALTNVVVKADVQVGTKAFDGCAQLASIAFPMNSANPKMTLIGNYAFSGCAKLPAVTISNTSIPAGTFNGCKVLVAVNDPENKAVKIAPTAIGESAFKETAITDIDLSNAVTIEANAFNGCAKLVGTKDAVKGINVLNVDKITTLNASVFEGCTGLKYVGFANVETVYTDFLKGTTCQEISFEKVIKVGGTTFASTSFGTVTGTVLFVNGGQKGIVDKTLTLSYTDESSITKTQNFTFKAIK